MEESLALGHEDDPNARVKKYVIGTKKDLKQQKKLLTVEDMQGLAEFNHYDTIRLQEVSALTAYGIQEVFSSIIDEVVGAGAPGMTDAPGADRPGMDSEEEEDSDEEEEDVSEEETKQEPDADGEEQTRAPKVAAPDAQDWITKQFNKKPKKKGGSQDGDPPAGGAKATAGKGRGKSAPQGKESSFNAKEMFQSFMPFLFEKQAENADGGKKKRK